MGKKRKSNKDIEDNAIRAIDKVKLMEEYLPAIQKFLRTGGTVEGFLRQSTPVAYARLATLLLHGDPLVAHKAAVEILNRAEGKPIERKQILHGDLADLNERQLDNEILRGLKKSPELAQQLSVVLEGKIVVEKPPKKRRAARKVNLLDE